jgi:heme exporter protein D
LTVSNFANDDGWANQWYSLSDWDVTNRRVCCVTLGTAAKAKNDAEAVEERKKPRREKNWLSHVPLSIFSTFFLWVVVAAAVLLIGMIISRVEQVRALLREYHNRINRLEVAKYDMEFEVKKKDFEVHNTRHTPFTLFTLFFLLSKTANY